MSDQDSQSESNPGVVERRLDEAPVEREGMQGGGVEREGDQRGDVDREGMQGSPPIERERQDEGQPSEREGYGAAERDAEQPSPQYDGSDSQGANRDEPDRGGGLS